MRAHASETCGVRTLVVCRHMYGHETLYCSLFRRFDASLSFQILSDDYSLENYLSRFPLAGVDEHFRCMNTVTSGKLVTFTRSNPTVNAVAANTILTNSPKYLLTTLHIYFFRVKYLEFLKCFEYISAVGACSSPADRMIKLTVDGIWMYCAILAASQMVGGCFRLHHEVRFH